MLPARWVGWGLIASARQVLASSALITPRLWRPLKFEVTECKIIASGYRGIVAQALGWEVYGLRQEQECRPHRASIHTIIRGLTAKSLPIAAFHGKSKSRLTDRLACDAAVLLEHCDMPFPNSFGHSQRVRFSKLS